MSRASGYPESMQTLIECFARMPGVGIRTAERLAFYVLGEKHESILQLSDVLQKVKETIRYCRDCYNLSEDELCAICSNATRQQDVLCVVEEPKDIITIEASSAYRGRYHVLLGALSPLDGIGPEDLKVKELVSRLKKGEFREIILATTSDTEGEATALYLVKTLKSLGIRITRLAQGIPMGSELEFADRATLTRAIEARHEIKT